MINPLSHPVPILKKARDIQAQFCFRSKFISIRHHFITYTCMYARHFSCSLKGPVSPLQLGHSNNKFG
jgi:hypothetical protein